jgi:2-dehydro-3-deoxyphosphooctonate aldolase (KDO 8-P synthase)
VTTPTPPASASTADAISPLAPRDDAAGRLLLDWFSAPSGQCRPLLIIAGPCVLESDEINLRIGETVRDACARLRLPYIFKASYDKANRSSIRSARGPGLAEGLERLARLRARLGVPVTTDIHEPEQARPAAEAVDVLQIPAFLCRQTDLLVAAASTGRPVNAKKGQFMAPEEMRNVVHKLGEGGAKQIMLTERGTFFGYHRLVNDFIGVGDLMGLGCPVCFDVTHSTQLPGGDKTATAGRPERGPLLARAAVAAGVDALFLECHPQPTKALSDASTMQPLESIPALLEQLVRIRDACASSRCVEV